MYTSIKLFKESLSSDVKFNTKVKSLIEKIERLNKIKSEIDDIDAKLDVENEQIKEVLQKMNTHSIICDGILIEIYGSYKSNRFSETKFFTAIEDSVDLLGDDLKEIAEKYREIYSKEVDIKYLKGNQNATKTRAGRPDGDYTVNEGVLDTIKKWFNSLLNWSKSFFKRAENNLKTVQKNLAKAGLQVSITESMDDAINTKQIIAHDKYSNPNSFVKLSESLLSYIGHSKYKKRILLLLSRNEYCQFLDLNGGTYNGMSNTLYYLGELAAAGIAYRIKKGRSFLYFLTPYGIQLCNETEEYKVSFSVTATESDAVKAVAENPEINKEATYDPADIVARPKLTFDKSSLGEALELSKELIQTNKRKLELKAEEEQLKEEAIKLFEELNLLDIVVNDKIYKLYSMKRTYLSATEFQKAITTVENVGEDIANTMSDIIAQTISEFDVAGSVRQFKDDSNLPDGTLGAHFDHETKRVVPANENVINKFVSWVFKQVQKLFNLRKRVETKLNTI